jgi:hypothetical protein
MAEDKVTDVLVDEEAQLKAQLDAIKRAEQPEPPAEAAAAEPIQEDPAEVAAKAAEAKAIADAKAGEDAARESGKQGDEARPPAGKAWQSLRAAQKKLEEREAELEVEKRRLEAMREGREPSKDPDFETQPADYLKKRTEHTDAELAQIRQELANRKAEDNYRNYIEGIKQQEAVFSKDHPDYQQATAFLIDKDVKQWERAGLARVHTKQVLEWTRSNNPQYTPYRQNVERLMNDAGVIAHAEKTGQDPEEVAAYVIARDTWLTTRRDQLAAGAREQGKTVAEVAYEEAVDRGWNGNPQESNGKQDAARARVQQAVQVAAASRSLSDSPSAEAGPEVRVLKNRNQVLDLDEESLDALIKSGNYRSL